MKHINFVVHIRLSICVIEQELNQFHYKRHKCIMQKPLSGLESRNPFPYRGSLFKKNKKTPI